MIEVFFRGEGDWYDINNIRGSLTGTCQSNGVFSLTDDDEIAYRHTGSLEGVRFLLPCLQHPDCEFSKMVRAGMIDGKIADKSAFRIYYSDYHWKNNPKIFTIAKPAADNNEPKTEAVGDGGADSKDDKPKQPKEKRSRKDNLLKAILAAIEVFDKKPSLEELWQYFQDDKDETGIIEDYTDTHITWKDTKGKLHDTQKETLANRLSRVNS